MKEQKGGPNYFLIKRTHLEANVNGQLKISPDDRVGDQGLSICGLVRVNRKLALDDLSLRLRVTRERRCRKIKSRRFKAL